MPLFFVHEFDAHTRLAVWRITEDEDFFDVPLQREITHPHKRRQHRAGRYLLRFLFPGFPLSLIQIADTRKPFLEDEAFHFSISHCGDYAAVIVSNNKRVGIDIELPSEKVERIRHKFISPAEELRLYELEEDMDSILVATMIWSAKEAAFKWYGKGGVDFRNDMPVQAVLAEDEFHFISGLLFRKDINDTIAVHTWMLGELCLSFVMSDL
jgi:phosphopantetheinyl transferase